MGIIGRAYLGTNQVYGAPPVAWTPADFTDVKYWWTADAGVTESGGNVTAWVDQIAGFSLTGINNPQLTTSATLNGENVIATNGTSNYLYSPLSPSSQAAGADLTLLSVINLGSTNSGGVFMGAVLIDTGNRLWVDTIDGYIRLFNEDYPSSGGGTAFTLETPLTTGARATKIRYDSSAGDGFYAFNTLTETSYATGGATGTNTWPTNISISMGATVNNTGGTVFGGRYSQVEIAEQVWIENTPTSGEMNNWKTYVNNKYGTIIA